MLRTQTLLQSILATELDSFATKNELSHIAIEHPLDISDGSFLFEVNSTSKAFQQIIFSEYRERIANYSKVSPQTYRHQLGEKIIKLDITKDITHVLKIIYETYKQLPTQFAGALIVTDLGAIINPLHPLIALELLKEKPNIIVKKLLIFTYKDLQKIDAEYSSDNNKIITNLFKQDIELLIQMYQSQIKNRAIKIEESIIRDNGSSIIQQYRVGKYQNEDDQKEYFIVAHQLLTKGTFVPFYGTSIIALGENNTTGFHLSPFKSCNINNHMSTIPASVCTGSTSNKTIKGLRTLHHANLGSPYESSCMSTVSKPYADECINYSFKIFQQANILPKD